MIAHVATNSQVLWYPFVALALPALIIVALTIYDKIRYLQPDGTGVGGATQGRARSGLGAGPRGASPP